MASHARQPASVSPVRKSGSPVQWCCGTHCSTKSRPVLRSTHSERSPWPVGSKMSETKPFMREAEPGGAIELEDLRARVVAAGDENARRRQRFRRGDVQVGGHVVLRLALEYHVLDADAVPVESGDCAGGKRRALGEGAEDFGEAVADLTLPAARVVGRLHEGDALVDGARDLGLALGEEVAPCLIRACTLLRRGEDREVGRPRGAGFQGEARHRAEQAERSQRHRRAGAEPDDASAREPL